MEKAIYYSPPFHRTFDESRVEFLQNAPVNTFYASFQVELKGSQYECIEILKNSVPAVFERLHPENLKAFILSFGTKIRLHAYFDEKGSSFNKVKRIVRVELLGDPELINKTYQKLSGEWPVVVSSKLEWYFRDSDGDLNYTTVDLARSHQARDEFYPWIREGLDSYFNRYLNDEANVLLLLGEPGTGKTSFIREFIQRNNMATMVTHDAKLMEMDQTFITFLTGDNDLLVLEDADTILRARSEGNNTMGKLLNAADGLIQTKKKMILTANITHEDDIDSALTRAGRCFEVMHFRNLTAPEAARAAEALGLENPDREVSLASLFKGEKKAAPRRTGF